ncbi:MAG TPA: protein-disulfide reductase DsbD domain-containing protein, partial [Gammaproteobacteria bacterium]
MIIRQNHCRIAGILLTLSLAHSWAAAHVGVAAIRTEHTEVSLLNEQQQIRPGRPFWVALQLKPESGWHTYWKNPGDAGKATTIKWNLPPGWKASPLYWPYPKRIRTGSLVSFGYTDTVSLLTEISANMAPPGTRKIEISATADWLVCKEICIPENATFRLSLSLGQEAVPDPETASVFKGTRALLPRNVSWTARYLYEGSRLVFDAP